MNEQKGFIYCKYILNMTQKSYNNYNVFVFNLYLILLTELVGGKMFHTNSFNCTLTRVSYNQKHFKKSNHHFFKYIIENILSLNSKNKNVFKHFLV